MSIDQMVEALRDASRDERARLREALDEAERQDPVEVFRGLLKAYKIAATNLYDPMRSGTPGEYAVHSRRAAEAEKALTDFVESRLGTREDR